MTEPSDNDVETLVGMSSLPEERCRDILKDHNNDVEQAAAFILEYLLNDAGNSRPQADTSRDAEIAAALAQGQDGLRRRQPANSDGTNDIPQGDNQQRQQQQQANPYNWLPLLLQGPLRILQSLFGGVWQLFSTFITTLIPGLRPFHPVPVEQQLRERFPGANLPTILDGGFNEAAAAVRREIKFLMVYIHSASASGNDHFVRLLSNLEVAALIQQRTVFYATDVATRVGFQTAAQLRAFAYPFVALLVPDEGALKLIWSSQDLNNMTPIQFATTLQTKMDQFEAILVAARADRASVASSQLLRQEQDAAFQQSLLEDQRKEEERRQRQEAEQQAQAAAAQAVADRQAKLARLQAEFPAEPEAGEDVVKIGIQLPHRERLSRRFRISDQVQMLYDFVFLQNKLETDFKLYKNQPKEELSDLTQTLADCELTRNTLLLCQADD